MNVHDIIGYRDRLNSLTRERRYNEAFALLIGVTESKMCWELTEKIKNLEESYKQMLRFAVEGMDDPGREDFLEIISEELDKIAFKVLLKQKLSENSYDVFINTFRVASKEKMNLAQFLDLHHNENVNKRQVQYERTKAVFDFIWTKEIITKEECDAIVHSLSSPDSSSITGSLIVGALLLRSLSMGYSTSCLTLLLDIYSNASDNSIKIKALTVFVILIMLFNKTVSLSIVGKYIKKIGADQLKQDLPAIVFELLRTKETERINKKMQNDILPNMMKMGPKIREKFRNLDEEEFADLEGNPEWRDMLKDSGILNSLEEMNRLQLEGADVMMSTFGHLKSFPFFNDVYAWFLPFDGSHPLVSGTLRDNELLKEFITGTDVLCDSDKYSFVFSVYSMARVARDGMLNTMKDQFGALKEMMKKRNEADYSGAIANGFIKNLYRFFNLYRRKDDFVNPFNLLSNPVDCKLLMDYLSTKDIDKIGEMLFAQEQWGDALIVFRYLEKVKPLSGELLQKLGFCSLKLGDFERAMTYLLHADMLNPDNLWTLNKIALCARKTGQWSTAIEYLEKVWQKEPTVKNAVAAGRCEMELGNYKGAVKQFYKAYYLNPDSPKVLRYLCRALVLSLDLDGAKKQLQKLMETVADSEDFILSGHIYFIKKDYKKAIEEFINAYRLVNGSQKEFFEKIAGDKAFLTESNGNKEIFNLMLEQLKYSIDC